MHGPPLTPQESVASVSRRVWRRESQGLNPEQAIWRTAVETGIDPKKVRWCADAARVDSPVRRSPSPRRRHGALAIAAVL